MKTLTSLPLIFAAVFTVSAAAEPQYFGTWRFNPAKSDLGSVEMTIAKVGQELELTDNARKSYRFKIDGKEYQNPYGLTVTWKEVKENEWEVAYSSTGKPVSVAYWVLSPDANTLTRRATLQTDRGTVEQSRSYRRAGEGAGIVGKWTEGKRQVSPWVLEITPNGSDGLVFGVAGVSEFRAKFDGQPYPMVGRQTSPGSTAAFTRIDSNSFGATFDDASGTMTATITVSSDGKTLTEVDSLNTGPKRTSVFDRQ